MRARTVYVNDVQVSSVLFTVETLGGLIPGFPALSLLIGLAVCVWGIKRGLLFPRIALG